jgi:hypothetical protein
MRDPTITRCVSKGKQIMMYSHPSLALGVSFFSTAKNHSAINVGNYKVNRP